MYTYLHIIYILNRAFRPPLPFSILQGYPLRSFRVPLTVPVPYVEKRCLKLTIFFFWWGVLCIGFAQRMAKRKFATG